MLFLLCLLMLEFAEEKVGAPSAASSLLIQQIYVNSNALDNLYYS